MTTSLSWLTRGGARPFRSRVAFLSARAGPAAGRRQRGAGVAPAELLEPFRPVLELVPAALEAPVWSASAAELVWLLLLFGLRRMRLVLDEAP